MGGPLTRHQRVVMASSRLIFSASFSFSGGVRKYILTRMGIPLKNTPNHLEALRGPSALSKSHPPRAGVISKVWEREEGD